MGSRTSTVLRKNVMVINFVQSHVSISFSCTVLETQNTGHSQHISQWKVIQAQFYEKTRWSETLGNVMFRSVFRALSQKFKILAIPNILADGRSYEHGFVKK
ncbi:hypothetical protein B296_00039017 [Ensete ventricosum]|uniref:Uncharacterized protein n=1 Tax=Ensete ventricosum TaxID=4639 RepID=A0A426XZK0_ENSVE|nr:hypothetical protein B296_00039017 [Ensete ventricosum]